MFKEKIKDLIKPKEEPTGKKKIENLVVLVIILVITIIAINSIWNEDKKTTKEETSYNRKLAENYDELKFPDDTYNNKNLEQSLETILSSISGVGKVKVFINYSESSTLEAMYNETKKESSTEETDDSGGVRTIQQTDTQKDIIYSEESRQ